MTYQDNVMGILLLIVYAFVSIPLYTICVREDYGVLNED